MELSFHLWKSQGPEKAKICLLHGMGGTGALWRPIAATLEDHFSILAPDQRGHGKSQIPHTPGSRHAPKYTPLEYGRDVIETLEKTEFHPTWLIGHSMGVRSACATAHLRPEWIQGMILIDLGFSGMAGGGLGENLASFLRILPMYFESRTAARDFMTTNCPDPAIGQYLMAVSTPAPTDPMTGASGGVTFPFDKAALIQTILAARDASTRTWVRELGERGMPILVLRGATSSVWTHEEFIEEQTHFADLPSVVFQEMAGTGHGLPFEKRIDFVHEVVKFIDAALS